MTFSKFLNKIFPNNTASLFIKNMFITNTIMCISANSIQIVLDLYICKNISEYNFISSAYTLYCIMIGIFYFIDYRLYLKSMAAEKHYNELVRINNLPIVIYNEQTN